MEAEMTSNQRNWTVLFSTMLAVSAVVITIFDKNGISEATVSLTLRLTAWTSFLCLLLVFVARPLRQLLKSPLTGKLFKNRRYVGIAMAGSHTVHLILIVWFFTSVSESGPTPQVLVFGGVGYVLLYLMLLTSFDRPAAAIGPTAWRRLHKTGLYWMGSVFAITFVSKFFAQPDNLTYQVSTLLILSTAAIRMAAHLRQKKT